MRANSAKGRLVSVMVVVAMLAGFFWAAPSADARVIEGDQVYARNRVIKPAVTVKGDILMRPGASLTVYGVVEGDIKISGGGNLFVTGRTGGPATVTGNITARGGGYIAIEDDATVEGNIFEFRAGHVRVGEGSTVIGNIRERGPGFVFIDSDSRVEGNIREHGRGGVHVTGGGLVVGNVCEGGPPKGLSVIIDADAVTGTVKRCPVPK
ncbi:MAG: hypothetical protein ACR2PK_12125 [Acidimicrobiales bacterium]